MSGKFDISGLDDVIHGRVRLGIVAYLASAEVADFTELKDLLRHAGQVEVVEPAALREAYAKRLKFAAAAVV